MSDEINYEVLRERRRGELRAASIADARANSGATDYAVRAWLFDGTPEPGDTAEMQWVSLGIAKRIAARAFEVRSGVVNSPVVAIEIIDKDYETVIKHEFKD